MTGLRMYEELAGWFHLITPPSEYTEEAELYRRLLEEAGSVRTILELGSGGGNNASHLKAHYRMTLTDPAPGMLEVSKSLNPECEHVQGDMRTLRLGRTFDAVFVHDAVDYMTTLDDLGAAMRTAFEHLDAGAVALFAPDHVRETFSPGTDHGGHDGEGRALRFLEWTWDPDPEDSTYTADYAYLLREGDELRAIHDRHVCGLFSRQEWRDSLLGAGFTRVESRPGPETTEVFLAFR